MKREDEPRTKWSNQHLREMPAQWYSDEDRLPEKFPGFAKECLLPLIEFQGYKQTEKEHIATLCLYQLIGAGLVNKCILDQRDLAIPGARLRTQVWDAIEKAGLCIKALGSESSQMATRYAATHKLLSLQKLWELYLTTNLRLARNSKRKKPTKHALVSVYERQEFDEANSRIGQRQLQKHLVRLKSMGSITGIVQVTEDILEAFNRNNLRFSWLAFNAEGHAFFPNPCLRQIHAGGFLRLARFYTFGYVGGQSLSKQVRRKMRIDNQRVAELDLEGSLLRMIYHKYGIDPDPAVDIYRPAEVFPNVYALKNLSEKKRKLLRNFVKKATIICLNTKSRGAANSSVGKLLAKSANREFLMTAIYQLEQSSPKGIVTRISKVHAAIKDDFFIEVGVYMMTRESQVIENAMLDFIIARKPALFIHDAVVVRRSDVEFAENAMINSYHSIFGFNPVLKRSF